MNLLITIWKESGKFYSSNIITSETNIPMFKEEFKCFIANNINVNLSNDGFITVQDINNEDNYSQFHNILYRCSEIKKYITE